MNEKNTFLEAVDGNLYALDSGKLLKTAKENEEASSEPTSEETSAPESELSTETAPAKGSWTMPVMIGLAVVVVALSGVLIFLIRKKRNPMK